MIYKIEPTNTNFKSKISALKPHNIGELNFRITGKIRPVRSAVEEILSKKDLINPPSGIEILKNGIKILAPLLGITSYTITIPDDNNSLDLSILKNENSEQNFKVIQNKVLKPNGKGFFSSQELKNLQIDSMIESVLDSADLPLLKIRQSLLPQSHPSTTIEFQQIKKTSPQTLQERVEESRESQNKTIIEETIPEKPIPERKTPHKPQEHKFNSESEVDKILDKLMLTPPKIRKIQTPTVEPTNISSIGRLTAIDKQLTQDVCELFKELDKLFEQNNRILNLLAKKFPSYDKYRKGQLISLKGLEGDDSTLSFTISIAKRMFNNPIHIICKRDSKHTIQEFIPMYGNKVLHAKDSHKDGETKSLIHYIRKNVHMTPDQIERLHISYKLSLIKAELTKYINYLKHDDSQSLSAETSKRLENFEKELLEVKKIAKNRYITRFNEITKKPTSVFNINEQGDKIGYTPKSENKYNRAFSVLIFFNKLKKESKGVGIYQDKLVKNYPIKNNREIPQKLKFCSNEDFIKYDIETELNKILDTLEKQIMLIKEKLKFPYERS